MSLAPDNLLQRCFAGIGHDLGIGTAIAFEEAEHDGFAQSTPSALAAHPAWVEVRFVGLNLAVKRRNSGALFSQVATQSKANVIDRAHRDTCQFRCIGGRQI